MNQESALQAAIAAYNPNAVSGDRDWGTAAVEGVVATGTTAVTGLLNTGIAVANMFGANTEEINNYNVLKSMDGDLGAFYKEHETSVDFAGTVAGGLVPGMVGVKLLRAAMAAKRVEAISGSLNLHKGLIESRKALETVNAQTTSMTNYFSGQFAGVLAKGVGAQLMDALAFETGSTLAQVKAPAYSDLTGSDLVSQVFFNTLAGGAIGGAFSGVKSVYGLGKARGAFAKRTFDEQVVIGTQADASTAASKLLLQVREASDTSPNAAIRKQIQEPFLKLADGDTRVATIAADAHHTSAINDPTGSLVLQTLPGTVSIKTLGTHLDDTADAELHLLSLKMPAAVARAEARMAEARAFTDVHTGNVYTSAEDVFPHIGDMLRKGTELRMAGSDKAVSMGDVSQSAIATYSPTVSAESLQARRFLLASKAIQPEEVLTFRDYADIEHHIQNWTGAVSVKLPSGVTEVIESPASLRMGMQEWKKADLIAAGMTPKAQVALNAKVLDDGRLGNNWDIAVASADYPRFASTPRNLVYSYGEDFNAILNHGDVPRATAYLEAVSQHAEDVRNKLSSTISVDLGLQDLNIAGMSDSQLVANLQRNSGTVDAGAGFLSNANAALDSFAFFAQKIGAWGSKATTALQDRSGLLLRPHLRNLMENWTTVGKENALLRNKLALTEANYAMITPEIQAAHAAFAQAGETLPKFGMIRQDYAEYLLKAIKTRKLPMGAAWDGDIVGDPFISTSEDVHLFQADNARLNLTRQSHSASMDASMGLQNKKNPYSGEGFLPVYNVPIDTSRYPNFVLVSQKDGLGATSHKSVMTARTADLLQAKVAKLQADFPDKYDFHYKSDTIDYFKAQGEFDYARGMNDNFVDSSMRRKGMLGEVDARNVNVSESGIQDMVNDYIAHNNRMDTRLVRDMIETRYANTFQTLDMLGMQHSRTSGSSFESAKDWWHTARDNPYKDAVALALNMAPKANFPRWLVSNEWVERAGTSVFSTSRKMFDAVLNSGSGLDKAVAEMNQHSLESGIGITYTKGMLEMYREQVATRPALLPLIHRSQAILSGLTLGLDKLNAVVNAIGQVVLTSELHSVLQGIKAGNAEVAGGLAGVKIPGLTDSYFAPVKLMGSSIARYWRGGEVFNQATNSWEHKTGQELIEQYRNHGIVADELVQQRLLQEELGSFAGGNIQAANAKIDAFLQFGRKWTGNQSAERLSRFLAADTARQITDHAMAQGLIGSEAEASAYWMTTANRAQGSIIASQRPIAFQGAIGSTIGLFMSFQMNMMQQFARYAGTGQYTALAAGMAAQTSLFGLQGLPAFNAINTHLVGNASGNINHKDLYSQIKYDFGDDRISGTNVGDWLLYGAGSNMLGLFHPDLKMNLYSRGDLNPRQWTVLPMTLTETPIYNSTVKVMSNFMDVISNLAGGSDVKQTLLHGLEHNGVSRSLSGIGSFLQGSETSQSGDMLTAIDRNILTLGVKLAGGKSLDSAQANDALYRMNAYKAFDAKAKKKLAEELKLDFAGGGATPEQLANFQVGYVKAGGRIDGFNAWAVRQYRAATVPAVNLFAMQQGNRLSQNMQDIMGKKVAEEIDSTGN